MAALQAEPKGCPSDGAGAQTFQWTSRNPFDSDKCSDFDVAGTAEKHLSNPSTVNDPHTAAMEKEAGVGDTLDRDISTDSTAIDSTSSAGVRDRIHAAKEAVQDKFQIDSVRVSSINRRLFNPTAVRIALRWKDRGNSESETEADSARTDSRPDLALLWTARNNRKGRNSVVIRHPSQASLADRQSYWWWPSPARRAHIASSSLEVGRNIIRMLTTFAYWDMGFWSGSSYTIGSILFILTGTWTWVPLAFPAAAFPNESTYGVPLTDFFGVLLFQVGGTMAYLEAVNDGSFHGAAIQRLVVAHGEDPKRALDLKLQAVVSRLWRATRRTTGPADHELGFTEKEQHDASNMAPMPARRGAFDLNAGSEDDHRELRPWRWYPTRHDLRTHLIYEIGYLACTVQLIGVTIYGVTGIVVLPGILDSLSQWQQNAAYWIPQMVASACFLLASVLFCLETQETWWRPAPRVLGWWIGVWAIIGSFGFLLCACLGPAVGSSGAQYQSALADVWGSTAYFLSGALQWYEAINKHPLDEFLEEPGELKSFQVHPA